MRTSKNSRAVLLVLLVVLAYLPVLKAGWIWDDDRYVLNNIALRSFEGLWRIWTGLRTEPQYYPLTHTGLWLQYHLFGTFPLGYHVVSLVLQSANAVLLYLALETLAIPGAFLAAALFAIHPVQAETVAWITEQKNLLSVLFTLLSLHAWLRGGVLAATALFVCAMLSKSTAAVLPAVFLVIVWWRSGKIERKDVKPLLPMFAIGAVMGLLTAALERLAGAEGADWSLTGAERLLIAGRAPLFYLSKLVFPFGLSFIYPRWELVTFSAAQWAFPVVSLGALFLLFGFRGSLGRGPAAAAFLFCGILFPVLGFFNVFPFRYSFVADHFQYLACIPLFALFSAGLARLSPPTLTAIAKVWIILLLSALTFQRAMVFENQLTLWQDTLDRNPDSWMVRYNMGAALAGIGQWGEATLWFRSAEALRPGDAGIHNNLGTLLLESGNPAGALEEFQLAVKLEPGNAQAHNNAGAVLVRLGRTKAAVPEYQAAVRLKPDFARAWFNLGEALAELGFYPEGAACLERALALQPDFPDAVKDLADLRARLSRRKPL